MTSLGFIGFGKMAEAIWRAYHRLHDGPTYVFDTQNDRLKLAQETYGLLLTDQINTLVERSDVVLLCIKPQGFTGLLPTLQTCMWDKKLLISILAGIPIQTLRLVSNTVAIARVMPNTPLQVGAGFSALCFDKTSPEQESVATRLFRSGGETLQIPESAINAVTGLSGSGPAFFYQLALATLDIGTRHGLSETETRNCIAQTMIGAGHMLLQDPLPIKSLIAQVRSPNGTTAAGLDEMSRLNVDQLFASVILKAIIRANELAN